MTTRRSAFASLDGLEKRPQPKAETSAAESSVTSSVRFISNEVGMNRCEARDIPRPGSEDEPGLEWEHARRVYIGERGNRVRGRADAADELAERRDRVSAVTVGRDAAAEEVAGVVDIKALKPAPDGLGLRQLDAILDEDGNVGGRRAAERRLGYDAAANDGAV